MLTMMASKVFRLVVFQESPGAWVSQCVDLDLNGQGSTVPEALESIKRVIVTQALLDQRDGVDLFSRTRPAPERFGALFERGLLLRDALAVSTPNGDVRAETAINTDVAA